MFIGPKILKAQVMHHRFAPKKNAFRYGVFYVRIPLNLLPQKIPGLNFEKFGLLSFHQKDHGHRDGRPITDWAREILASQQLDNVVSDIALVCMPRVLGMSFNPVSFWFCHDSEHRLRAVIAEVNNTFGETHTYLCTNKGKRPITKDDWIEADKLFHVSPFMEREGYYKFRFAETEKTLAVEINHHAADGSKLLDTSVVGTFEPLTKRTALWAFLSHPLLAAKVVGLIHYQAARLFFKGVRYVPKPKQIQERLSHTRQH